MKIGYLHLGIPQKGESGVTRYGRLICAEAKKNQDLEIIEARVTLTKKAQEDRVLLAEAANKLSEADLVHVQFSKHIWGGGWHQLSNLRAFFNCCRVPVVATVHDALPATYPPYGIIEAWKQESYRQREYSNFKKLAIKSTLVNLWQNYLPDAKAVRFLSSKAQTIITCTQEEARRLHHLVERKKSIVIPHFVEQRDAKITPEVARVSLGLEGFKVVTLQGFIVGRKGHKLLIEALAKLPPDIKVIFAGGTAPNTQKLLEDLLKLAEAKGVRERLVVTGYLSDEDLERCLMASHLAVCPFEVISASGSLSTWISLARPILASDIPQIEEYNTIEPGAIKIFNPYTAEALAEAIQEILAKSKDGEEPAVASLREKLSMPAIFEQHLRHYKDLVKMPDDV